MGRIYLDAIPQSAIYLDANIFNKNFVHPYQSTVSQREREKERG